MENEIKVAELAALWGVSVPTVWNRIKKMGLKTVIKKSETNKDINYVYISEEQIKSFNINVINNDVNLYNNGYYKELLTDNNLNNEVVNADYSINTTNRDGSIIKDLINYNKDYNERLLTVYENYNNRIERLNNELITYKERIPLLEDKAGREGLYLKEIDDLKAELKTKNTFNKVLLTFIIILLMLIITSLTYLITVDKFSNENKIPAAEEKNISTQITQETLAQ